jgi:hypothetical protein
MSSEYVGILVNQSLYRRIPSGKTKHEKLTFYEEAGRRYDLRPCYFRLQDIQLSTGRVLAYVRGSSGYRLRWLPLPQVIHNRAIHKETAAKRKLKHIRDRGIQLFNACNRYSKLLIHDILMTNPNLRPHLPGTEAASPHNLPWFMHHYDELILKPDNSSIGRGIMMMRKVDGVWRLHYPSKNGLRERSIAADGKLPTVLVNKITKTPYVLQQRLPLATFRGRPFDLRISVQKNETGSWQVTGIAGKLAAPGKYVTNVAQGGTVLPLEILLQEYPQLAGTDVRGQLEAFSLEAARTLESRLEGLADIGLDIGMTVHGYPVFIECNCRDLRYSFQAGGMHQNWKASYANPIGYARYLIDQAAAGS